MDLHEVGALDTRAHLTEVRRQLLQLLSELSPQEWAIETQAPGWTVKDVALHLLDDDLGVLSRSRDDDDSGLLEWTAHREFVRALAQKNQRWIEGARPLSTTVLVTLLGWSGQQLDEYYAGLPLDSDGHVSWASDEPVPMWLDMGREFTERWVHQMQIREAVDRVEDHAAKYLQIVLRTFVWSLPHQFDVTAEHGVTVQVDLASGGVWHLRSLGGSRWTLEEGEAKAPEASAHFTDDAGWRWFVRAPVPPEGVAVQGPSRLVDPLLQVRAIIA